jgi:hypothetical protein
MRYFWHVSDRGLGFRFLVVLAVMATSLTTLTQGAVASSSPATVLSGLSGPSETATTTNGDLYFIEFTSNNLVTLSRLRHGQSTSSVVYKLNAPLPYINDIHFDPEGNLIFIASRATNTDGTARRWDLTRVEPRSGASTTLATTTGVVPSPSDPTFNCVGADCGLHSGTEIDLAGVSGDGIIYFSEHTNDPVTGSQTADLMALDPGSLTPRHVEHFANPGDSLIATLTVAKGGEVYFNTESSVYQWTPANTGDRSNGDDANGGAKNQAVIGTKSGTLRVLMPAPTSAVNSGLDAEGNLYLIERHLNGRIRFGCAKSTIITIARFSAETLASANPTPVTVSEATYDGFWAGWVGSSSFFRVSRSADVYWNVTRFDCSDTAKVNYVLGTAHGQLQQTLLYQEDFPPGPDLGLNPSAGQGPIGLATFGDGVYIASMTTGKIFQIRLKGK